MLEQVAEGTAICFAPCSMAQYYARPDLSWVSLTDVEPLRVALAWADDTDNSLVQGFAHVVRELAVSPQIQSSRSLAERHETNIRVPSAIHRS
ncbi:hypothetical protein [Actinacidiphila oryziradicis]|uniref:hypothetical protein n=1 Tax=Actinacidiphila oryziradicis TaxID=2571141 RepID=UPI001FE3C8D7|nr:hypothetical protein [Actinacidiphila oryziradicis]